MVEDVPVVDFSAYCLERDSPDPVGFQKLVDEVHKALSTFGFMRLRNSGVPVQKTNHVFELGNQFFQLDDEVKKRFIVYPNPRGYLPMSSSRLNPESSSYDLRESFKFQPTESPQPFQESEIPGFQEALKDFFCTVTSLYLRLLEVAAIGLKLEDKNFFTDRTRYIGTEKNPTQVSVNYYPALTNMEVKKGDVRLGEHTDIGGLTLLFQDSMGGLEVRSPDGEWVPVKPIEGSVIVNIGELMQRWTSDVLVAGKHRVVIPDEEIRRRRSRMSLVVFGVPDLDVMIECADSSNKYPPVKCQEYWYKRLQDYQLMQKKQKMQTNP